MMRWRDRFPLLFLCAVLAATSLLTGLIHFASRSHLLRRSTPPGPPRPSPLANTPRPPSPNSDSDPPRDSPTAAVVAFSFGPTYADDARGHALNLTATVTGCTRRFCDVLVTAGSYSAWDTPPSRRLCDSSPCHESLAARGPDLIRVHAVGAELTAVALSPAGNGRYSGILRLAFSTEYRLYAWHLNTDYDAWDWNTAPYTLPSYAEAYLPRVHPLLLTSRERQPLPTHSVLLPASLFSGLPPWSPSWDASLPFCAYNDSRVFDGRWVARASPLATGRALDSPHFLADLAVWLSYHDPPLYVWAPRAACRLRRFFPADAATGDHVACMVRSGRPKTTIGFLGDSHARYLYYGLIWALFPPPAGDVATYFMGPSMSHSPEALYHGPGDWLKLHHVRKPVFDLPWEAPFVSMYVDTPKSVRWIADDFDTLVIEVGNWAIGVASGYWDPPAFRRRTLFLRDEVIEWLQGSPERTAYWATLSAFSDQSYAKPGDEASTRPVTGQLPRQSFRSYDRRSTARFSVFNAIIKEDVTGAHPRLQLLDYFELTVPVFPGLVDAHHYDGLALRGISEILLGRLCAQSPGGDVTSPEALTPPQLDSATAEDLRRVQIHGLESVNLTALRLPYLPPAATAPPPMPPPPPPGPPMSPPPPTPPPRPPLPRPPPFPPAQNRRGGAGGV